MDWIEQRLFELRDTESQYRTFNARVVATADPATMLGVRVPKLRRLAKEILRSDSRDAFLEELPHTYYEEYLLHAFVLNEEKDAERTIAELDRLLPFVDNWAVSDALMPKSFRKLPPERLEKLSRKWMASEHEYTHRFGISLLMRYLLPDGFRPEHLLWAQEADDGRYYIEMMVGGRGPRHSGRDGRSLPRGKDASRKDGAHSDTEGARQQKNRPQDEGASAPDSRHALIFDMKMLRCARRQKHRSI